jgi:hypothetical protein
VTTALPNFADPIAPTNVAIGLAAASNSTSRQNIWLRVRAPTAGVNPCNALAASTVAATFTVDVTVTSTNGQKNTKKVTVTYPKAGS